MIGVDRDQFKVDSVLSGRAPFFEPGLEELVQAGVRQVVGLVLAPHYSALSVGEYIQRVKAANNSQVKLTTVNVEK